MNLLLKKNRFGYSIEKLKKNGALGFFTRRPFNYDFRAAKTALENKEIALNRKNFCRSLGIEIGQLVFPSQVHGARIHKVSLKDKARGAYKFEESIPDTDALICDDDSIALAILTADCLPIILFEPDRRVIGLIHAGWRGTEKQITALTADNICAQYRLNPGKIEVYIGPGIRACCYEVGEDFNDKFTGAVTLRNKRYYLDLVEINIGQLVNVGIKKKNIFDSALCTSCKNDEFFSFRRNDKTSRMLTLIMLDTFGESVGKGSLVSR